MARIKIIEPENATGKLKEIYSDLVKRRGKIATVHKMQSLNPESIVNHMDLYMTLMYGKSPIRRAQREMIAVVVSSANNCRYCIMHHSKAMEHFWRDESRVGRFAKDFTQADLEPLDRLLCHYASTVTLTPGSENIGELIIQLKNHGLDDRGILDATLIIAYFNFINRMVMALDIELENNPGGYKYD